MATAKQLDDIIECAICTEIYKDPRSLPCIHTFCFECIAKTCKDKQPGDAGSCPLCRKEFVIPANGVEGLPKNFFVEKVMTVKQFSRKESETKLCEVCREEDYNEKNWDRGANVFCMECRQNMCKMCSSSHSRMSKTRSHKTLILGQDQNTDEIYVKCPSTFCEKHRQKEIEIYCSDCKIAVCMMCFVEDHNKHQCSDVNKVFDEFRAELKRDIQEVAAAAEKFDEPLKNMSTDKASFLDKVKQVEVEICERADHLAKTIAKEKAKLLAELSEVKAGRIKEMDVVYHDTEQDKSSRESFVKYCDEILKKGAPGDIAREINGLRERAAELTNVECIQIAADKLGIADVNFIASNVTNSEESSIVGKIMKEHTCTDSKLGTPTLLNTITGSGAVTAITVHKTQLFVSRDGLAQVSVYDTTSLQLQRQLTVTGFSTRLWGLAACATTNSLYVSDLTNNVVHRVDLSTQDNNTATKWSVAAGPRELSVNSVHHVLVACCESKKIQEFTTTGTLVREITDGNNVWQAIELHSGNLVISRNGPVHGVCIVSTSGQVIHSFGNQAGSGAGQMSNPYGLAVTKQGFILVANYGNHRILAVNPSLTDARQLPLDVNPVIQDPCALHYDLSRGRLYVGEWGGQNRLLVFDNVVGISGLFNK